MQTMDTVDAPYVPTPDAPHVSVLRRRKQMFLVVIGLIVAFSVLVVVMWSANHHHQRGGYVWRMPGGNMTAVNVDDCMVNCGSDGSPFTFFCNQGNMECQIDGTIVVGADNRACQQAIELRFGPDVQGCMNQVKFLGESTTYNGTRLIDLIAHRLGSEGEVHCIHHGSERFCATRAHQICVLSDHGEQVTMAIGRATRGTLLCDSSKVDSVTVEIMRLFNPTEYHPIGDIVSLYGLEAGFNLPGTPYRYVKDVNTAIASLAAAGFDPRDMTVAFRALARDMEASWTPSDALRRLHVWNSRARSAYTSSHSSASFRQLGGMPVLSKKIMQSLEAYITEDYVLRLLQMCVRKLWDGMLLWRHLFTQGPVRACMEAANQ